MKGAVWVDGRAVWALVGAGSGGGGGADWRGPALCLHSGLFFVEVYSMEFNPAYPSLITTHDLRS